MALLDIALENYFRLCIERMDKASLSGDDLIELVALVLHNAVIAIDSVDLGQALFFPRQAACKKGVCVSTDRLCAVRGAVGARQGARTVVARMGAGRHGRC